MNLIKVTSNFNTDEKCLEYLSNLRWAKMKYCPYCKSTKISRHKEKNRRSRWQCSGCKRSFSPTVNTIFHGTRLPLQKWFVAISLVSDAKKSLSSRQLARHIDVPVKTAYSLMQRLRKAMYGARSPLLQGVIEIDETYIGGKPRYNRPYNKRGRGTKKQQVVGIVERKGSVIAMPTSKAKQKDIRNFIIENIDMEKTEIYTDEYRVYSRIGKMVSHRIVNHGRREYVNGDCHTNTIEGFWSLLKRAWYGQHHHYSKKYLPLYVAEAAFKYNNRKNHSETVFTNLMRGMLCINS